MTGHRIRGEGSPLALWLATAVLGAVCLVSASVLAVNGDDGADIDIDTATPGPAGPVVTGDGSGGGDGSVGDGASTTSTVGGSSAPPTPAPGDCPPLFTVYFSFGSPDLVVEGIDAEAAAVAAWLLARPEAVLLVDGHADSAGSEADNLALSFRRAGQVADRLVDAGAPAGQVQARGFGEYQAVAGEPADSDRNRRVTMTVDGMEGCVADGPGGVDG